VCHGDDAREVGGVVSFKWEVMGGMLWLLADGSEGVAHGADEQILEQQEVVNQLVAVLKSCAYMIGCGLGL
jgi:hypothetical protein